MWLTQLIIWLCMFGEEPPEEIQERTIEIYGQ